MEPLQASGTGSRSPLGSNYVWRAPASTAGPLYRFGGQAWPRESGANLGAVGAWNLLFRMGQAPQWLTEPARVQEGDVVWAISDVPITDAVRACLARGATVVGAGAPTAWRDLVPGIESRRDQHPYAALAALAPTRILAPPGWDHARIAAPGGRGQLGIVHGERQSPARALVTPLADVPVSWRRERLLYLNANPFAAFQAWVQGQEELTPWLGWRNRLFWLDEYGSELAEWLVSEGVLAPAREGRTTVVLRHDLDYSRDTTYLELEREFGVPGVHAVLKDQNTDFWLQTLKQAPEHEVAFHYNTAHYSRWMEAVRSRLGLRKRSYRPARAEVAGQGLLAQVRWAKRAGVGVATLHRHLSYLVYPEWVDGMDEALAGEPAILGSSSLFRGTVLRWGSDQGETGLHPDAQFPYWYPVRLARGDTGQPLRGWESASVMEVEPGLVEQMLRHQAPHLPARVITLNFHPSHASVERYCSGGSQVWFREILELLRSYEVVTLQQLYSQLTSQC